MRIFDVLQSKASQDVVTISPDATVRDLVALLAEHNIGAVIVSGDGSAVDGIVSERDIVRHLSDPQGVLDAAVVSIMTGTVHTCEQDTRVDELMGLMTEQRVRHVPVLTDGQLSGIISIGDVVKQRISELEFERDQLDSYIQG